MSNSRDSTQHSYAATRVVLFHIQYNRIYQFTSSTILIYNPQSRKMGYSNIVYRVFRLHTELCICMSDREFDVMRYAMMCIGAYTVQYILELSIANVIGCEVFD